MSEGDEEIEKQKKEIERMQNEFRQYRDRVKENEKRTKDKTKKDFIKNLLETLDNLYVITNRDEGEKSEDVKITYDGLMRAFNMKAISPAHGQYIDEIKHIAIDTFTNPNYPENTIVYTVRKGYCFDDEVIRPAEVVVFVGGKQVKKSEETHKEMSEMPKKKGLFDKFFSPILNIVFKVIFKDKTRYLEEKTEGILLKEQEITKKENLLTEEFEELKQRGENLTLKEQEITGKEYSLTKELEELKQREAKAEKIFDAIKSYKQENINKKFEIMSIKKFEIMSIKKFEIMSFVE